MVNVIDAVLNIVKHNEFSMKLRSKSGTRVNSEGDSLEEYVADVFADTFDLPETERLKKIQEVFSYRGNQNNPPDIILKNGDAIEVKKIKSLKGEVALNSSPPKDHLYCDDTRISAACKKCENWKVKDIMYVVGTVNKSNTIEHLSIVYGVDYAASRETYGTIAKIIKEGILNIPDVEFNEETNELGRVNKVDPLGITYLRIRGMWHIENPLKVYDYIYTPKKGKKFNMFVLINETKYESIQEESKRKLENELKTNLNLQMKNVEIKDPNNPARLKKAKMITYSV